MVDVQLVDLLVRIQPLSWRLHSKGGMSLKKNFCIYRFIFAKTNIT